MIEQAIFTSARSSRNDGYHLVATSPGVTEQDARELAIRGPTHDSLNRVHEVHSAGAGRRAHSTNFHPLPSGAYCVSVTTPAGAEYSGRRGPQVYTQCLVVPPQVLQRFANNPFRLLEAASAAGHIKVLNHFPSRLKPFSLSGRASTFDRSLLDRLSYDPGRRRLAALLQLSLTSDVLGIAGATQPDQLVAGLVMLVPPACRTEFSFSTGLKVSTHRTFRIVAIENRPEQRHRLLRVAHARLFSVAEEVHEPIPSSGWAALVFQLLRDGNLAQLEELFEHASAGVTLANLDDFAARWLPRPQQAQRSTDQDRPEAMTGTAPSAPAAASFDTQQEVDSVRSAHAAHQDFQGQPDSIALEAPSSLLTPAAALDLACHGLMEQLEQADTAVLQAIQGDPQALEQLRTLWPEIVRQLAPHLVEESREQYLRYALSMWLQVSEQNGMRDAQRAATALDVLTMLFES